ncbi:MAG: hypothetical protein QW579_05245 [Desulfurococcaceae archaeon]
MFPFLYMLPSFVKCADVYAGQSHASAISSANENNSSNVVYEAAEFFKLVDDLV